MTSLPTDNNGNSIPTMRLRADGAHAITATGTAASNTTAFSPHTKVISVYATADIFMRFGNVEAKAQATDHFFPAKTYYDFAIEGGGARSSHLSVLRAGANDATVYLSEKM